MNNIFENAYFGKPYKTRDGRRALFMRKDEDTFDLETEESYNPVRADGTFLYTKEGYESSCDIISEWQEEINEEELDRMAKLYTGYSGFYPEYDLNGNDKEVLREAYKAGYYKAKGL